MVVHESQDWLERALNRTAAGGCSWVGCRLLTAREEGGESVLRWPPVEENKTTRPAAGGGHSGAATGCEENEGVAGWGSKKQRCNTPEFPTP